MTQTQTGFGHSNCQYCGASMSGGHVCPHMPTAADLSDLDDDSYDDEYDDVTVTSIIDGTDAEIDFVGEGPDENGWENRTWNVTLTHDGRMITVPFHTGMAIQEEPTAKQVLSSLVQDARSYRDCRDVQEFANEFGYSNDFEDMKVGDVTDDDFEEAYSDLGGDRDWATHHLDEAYGALDADEVGDYSIIECEPDDPRSVLRGAAFAVVPEDPDRIDEISEKLGAAFGDRATVEDDGAGGLIVADVYHPSYDDVDDQAYETAWEEASSNYVTEAQRVYDACRDIDQQLQDLFTQDEYDALMYDKSGDLD